MSPTPSIAQTRLRAWGRRKAPSLPWRLGLGEIADHGAERAPGAPVSFDEPLAIAADAGGGMDRAGFARLVEDAAGWLHAAGARRDSRVAIVKRNGFDVIALACAAARIGAVPAPLAPGLAPDDLAVLLGRLAPDLLLTDGRTWADRLQAGPPQGARVLSVEGDVPGAIALDDVRGGPPASAVRRDPSSPAMITHTSGTTAVPKLVVHSAVSMNGQARMQMPLAWLLLRDGDTIGACLQWAHARSMALWLAVGHLRSPILAMSRTEADSVARVLARHRPAYFEADPKSFLEWEQLAARDDRPFGSVRVFMSTFDAAHPRTIRAMLSGSTRRLPLYVQVYAQSETGGISVRLHTRATARTRRGRNVGGPIRPFTRMRIVDPDSHEPRRTGQAGEIEAITPGICLGYLGEEVETAGRREGRWWRTGDLGRKDVLGRLHLLDRKVDAAEGIPSTLALEDALLDRLPHCDDVIVLAEAGRVVPVVCMRDGTRLHPDEWSRAAAGLGELGEPIAVQASDMPRTATGKVRRSRLAASIRSAR